MNYSNIKYNDIANGSGVRVSLFVSGCERKCKGCFNFSTWDFNSGNLFTKDIKNEILKNISDVRYSGLSILGGEPLNPNNIEEVNNLIYSFREKFGDSRDIWLWSGYSFDFKLNRILTKKEINKEIIINNKNEELVNKLYKENKEDTYFKNLLNILFNIDYLVEGPYIEEEKNISLAFRGSSNQRIINISKTYITYGNPEKDIMFIDHSDLFDKRNKELKTFAQN